MRFPLIIGIVFIHNNMVLPTSVECSPWVIEVVNLFGDVIPRICVPLFFIISGYLFFLNLENTHKAYIAKIHRRFYTLFLPYLLWNSIAFILLILFGNISISNISHQWTYLLNVFFDFRGGMPANFPMWFIRDLLMLVLIAPVIKTLLCTTRGLILILFLLLWFMEVPWLNMLPRCSSILFFMAGAFLSIHNINLLKPSFFGGRIFIILYPLFAIVDLITKESFYHSYFHKIGVILGILMVLYIVPILIKKKKFRFIFKFEDMSFFVFGAHALFIYRLTSLIHKVINPQNPYLLLFLYFFVGLFTVFVCCCSCYILRRFIPTLSAVLEGNFFKKSLIVKKMSQK
ncbi:MAG: acyltransferase [Bacteroidales bacterium]